MPELPELEILKDELNAHVLGRQVKEVIVPEGRGGDCPVPEWKSAIEGATIVRVERRGKMLVLQFDSGFSLLIHLMMVGQLLLSSLHDGDPNDVRLILAFASEQLSLGQVALRFLQLVPTSELDELPQLKKLGHDPTSEGFTVGVLKSTLAGRRGKVKPLLLNQSLIAGIGNTYADEILFDGHIAPTRQASSLSDKELQRLHSSIVDILRRGLEMGGSSEMAFVHLDGRKGAFQEHFQVKQREGKPCKVCGSPIEKATVGGRGTYFCARCQE
ncbi:MAG: DNA-formamidopyrimidine glycosylase [Chloroflexi bacterium B3_Chlor]|nr:MAG: DNA-formamidopyrimidine glycosylase [Chloroflexi bacterium B3_Chlor]